MTKGKDCEALEQGMGWYWVGFVKSPKQAWADEGGLFDWSMQIIA